MAKLWFRCLSGSQVARSMSSSSCGRRGNIPRTREDKVMLGNFTSYCNRQRQHGMESESWQSPLPISASLSLLLATPGDATSSEPSGQLSRLYRHLHFSTGVAAVAAALVEFEVSLAGPVVVTRGTVEAHSAINRFHACVLPPLL